MDKNPKPSDSFRAGTARYAIVLSAMRSGSTLLKHIIAQQPHVLSAGETKIEYRGPDAFRQLRRHLFDYQKIAYYRRLSRRWLFLDKMVQVRYLSSTKMMASPSVRFVFLVREPHAALSSLMEKNGWPYTDCVESAIWYYCRRLEELAGLARELPDPAMAYFLSYEDLLGRTADHLSAMSRFFGFERRLEENYPAQTWTQEEGLGDISSIIRSGTIRPNVRHNLVTLSQTARNRLAQAYAAATSELERLCHGQGKTVIPAIGDRKADPFGADGAKVLISSPASGAVQLFEDWNGILDAHELKIGTGLFQLHDKESDKTWQGPHLDAILDQHRTFLLHRGLRTGWKGCLEITDASRPCKAPGDASLSVVLASHVARYEPDLVGWLRALHRWMKPDGTARLILKDKRFSEDVLCQESTVSALRSAFAGNSDVLSRELVSDHRKLNVKAFCGRSRFRGRINIANTRPDSCRQDPGASTCTVLPETDSDPISIWVFSPKTFALCMADLAEDGLIAFQCPAFVDSSFPAFDFFVDLVKNDNPTACADSWRAAAALCGELPPQ